MGSWHGVLWRAPRGASVWVPCREACCVSSHTGGHGTPHSWVLAPTGNMLTCGCILWGSCWTMHTQSQGCWCPGPYPAPPMWGLEGCKDDGSSCIYGFGHGTAWPCSICGHQGWGPNQQGQRLPGSTPAFPRGPKFLPWGPPLPSVCVEGGFASSPPLLRYFGAVCPALVSAATVEGVEAMYNRTGGVLWVLPCVLLWVPPSQGRQEDCGRQFWPRLRPASWTVAVRAVLGTEHPLNHVQSGGGTAGAQHPGLGAWQGVRARCKRAATGRGVRAGPATLPGLCRAATPRDEPLWAIPGQGEDGFTMDWGRRRGRQ